MKKDTKTKQQLLLEIKQLRKKLDATERRLQEANEIFQAEVTERKRRVLQLEISTEPVQEGQRVVFQVTISNGSRPFGEPFKQFSHNQG